jgi:hypothetical protein
MKYKIKSIKIKESTHKILKKFCDERNFKLNSWADSVILYQIIKIMRKENDNLQDNKSNK